MNTSIIPELEEQRRDALVDYYLGQIVPSTLTSAPPTLITPEDLYEYLLIDNQVNAQVETSRVAQAIASIQQYIHAIFNGMEPGYSDGFDTEYLQLWREGISEYSVWAGYQMIEDYPENYIDPALRLTKTEAFKELELDLGQSRITQDSVQSALNNYLNKFEVVSNLNVVSGYIDGNDFKHADYYFVGRQRVEPFSHYWRKVTIALDVSPTIPAGAWTEWKKIDVAFDATVTHVRPMVSAGRLRLVWVESGLAKVEDDGRKAEKFQYSAKMSFLQLNNIWSPATTLYSDSSSEEDLTPTYDASGNFVKGFALVATMDLRRPFEPRLIVDFQWRGSINTEAVEVNAPDEGFTRAYDKFFNAIVLTDLERKEVLLIAARMFGTDQARLQHPYLENFGSDGKLVLVSSNYNRDPSKSYIPSGGINELIELETTLISESETQAGLLLRGYTHARREERNSTSLTVDAPKYDIEKWVENKGYIYDAQGSIRTLNGVLYGKVWMHITKHPITIGVVWKYKDTIIGQCGYSQFKMSKTGDSWWGAAEIILSLNPNAIPLPAADVIRAGMEFSLALDFIDLRYVNIPLRSENNSFFASSKAVQRRFDLWRSEVGRPDVSLWSGTLSLNGAASSSQVYIPLSNTDANVYGYKFGVSSSVDNSIGNNWFDIVLAKEPGSSIVPFTQITKEGAQFLDLGALGLTSAERYLRLNTLFAQELASKIQFSVESVLNWENQHMLEPPAPSLSGSDRNNWIALDFKGANTRYLWEIFFHVAHLVAHRLYTEFDYLGAEKWLHTIFNPQVRIEALFPAPSEEFYYWLSRPLTGPDDLSFELEGLGDPDAIAYSVPSHYRKMIVMFYLNNLVARGDMLYRQLTRDALNEAKLHYVRALSLLGPLSKGRSLSQWEPIALEDAAKKDSDVIPTFAIQLWKDPLPVPLGRAKGQPWVRLLNAPRFRLPVNTALLDQWERLDLRLSNLRNNLTLDGKPLQLALYEPPANPFDLLRAQLAGGGNALRRLGSLAIIPPYRFRALLPRVQNAVETLIRYGDQVRSYMEMRDRANQEELQQSHVLELSTFTQQLQEQALEQAHKSKEALETSRATIKARWDYYSLLVKDDVTSAETAGMVLNAVTGVLHTASSLTSIAGHIIDMTPTIFGPMVSGGGRPSGAAFAAGAGFQGLAQVTSLASDLVMTNEYYRRRRVEWTFQVEQAELELAAIDKQLELQTLAIASAETSQAQAIKAQEQAQAYYSFLKNRATGPALYQWLLSQMATMYFQAYDVVLSMCLSAEACWQYEIGDRDTHFVPTNAWTDNYHGLTAGEALKLGLLRMESSYLNRHERRLELTKTVSLRKLFELKTKDAPEGLKWEQVVETFLGSEGTGTCRLT